MHTGESANERHSLVSDPLLSKDLAKQRRKSTPLDADASRRGTLNVLQIALLVYFNTAGKMD